MTQLLSNGWPEIQENNDQHMNCIHIVSCREKRLNYYHYSKRKFIDIVHSAVNNGQCKIVIIFIYMWSLKSYHLMYIGKYSCTGEGLG